MKILVALIIGLFLIALGAVWGVAMHYALTAMLRSPLTSALVGALFALILGLLMRKEDET